jgi:hypothetical protein
MAVGGRPFLPGSPEVGFPPTSRFAAWTQIGTVGTTGHQLCGVERISDEGNPSGEIVDVLPLLADDIMALPLLTVRLVSWHLWVNGRLPWINVGTSRVCRDRFVLVQPAAFIGW